MFSSHEAAQTVKAEQGPAGLPIGKTGMSKDLLGKLLTHVAVEAKKKKKKPLPHYSLETVHGWC